MKYGLSDQTLQKIHDVFLRYSPVEEAVLYGSRARGDYKNGSDIDLTLRGGDALTHTILSKIANDLDDHLLLIPLICQSSRISEIPIWLNKLNVLA